MLQGNHDNYQVEHTARKLGSPQGARERVHM